MFKLIFQFFTILLIPLVYFLGIFIISYPPFIHWLPINITGLIISFIGLILWATSYIYLRGSLSVLPKAKQLVTTGPYKYFSHPVYLGINLALFGLSLGSGSIPGVLYTILIVIPLNFLRAKTEEKELSKKFGQEYKEYKKRVLF